MGIEEGYLLLDYPETSMSEYRVKVRTPTGLRMINEVSPLAKSLEASEMEKLTVNLIARREDAEKFKAFQADDYFRLRQKRLSRYL